MNVAQWLASTILVSEIQVQIPAGFAVSNSIQIKKSVTNNTRMWYSSKYLNTANEGILVVGDK